MKEPLRGTRYNTRDGLIRAEGLSVRNVNNEGRADGPRPLRNTWKKVINKGRVKGDWDFQISDLVKTLMELIFNSCGEFR